MRGEEKKKTATEREQKREETQKNSPSREKKTRTRKKKINLLTPGNDQDEYGFERGSTKSYALRVRHPIGRLRRVRVAQVEPSACDLGTAWFLEKVCVLPPSASASSSSSDSSSSAASKKIEFPCSGWLGSDEISAESFLSSASVMERELAPAGSG